MIARKLTQSASCFALLGLLAGASWAQSPSSLADNNYEYNAYNYSYISKVIANGLADAMADDGVEGEVALLVSDLCDDAFFHCYDALVEDDDSLWTEALDDLEMARSWCNTLIVFAEDSQPSSVQQQIDSLMWYLDIAIENADKAKPVTKSLAYPSRFSWSQPKR